MSTRHTDIDDEVARRTVEGPRVVIFRRAEGWYPIELRPGENVLAHIELNPGTLSVEDALTGDLLWSPS